MISSDNAYDLFVRIANASGIRKQLLLRGTDVTKYLLAAYDPFTKYHVTKGKEGEGVEEFSESTWDILRALSIRKFTGLDAQMLVDACTQEMTEKSAKLFIMILNKDLRMGMGVKTINKVFPGLVPTHDVMLAKLFDIHRVKYPCFGSPKIDGVRGDFKNGGFYSRGGHLYTGLDHLIKELASVTESITGELIVPGLTFQESSGMIRSNNPTPTASFHMIDLPQVENQFTERLTYMDDLHLIGNHVLKVPHKILYSEDEVLEYYQACRMAEYEGAVIKSIDYEYRGTRSYDWMKMKPKDTIDVVVTGIYEGKGKYKSIMGGVTVDFNGVNNVGGGWSDEQRFNYWVKPLLIVGKCIEVSYMELTNDGNFRHANFERLREDK